MGQDNHTLAPMGSGGIFCCRYDPEWTVIRADKSLYDFLGYTEEEFETLFRGKMAGVIHPDDMAPMYETVARQLKSGPVIVNENRLICKDGTVKWIWISAELTRDQEQGEYFYCMFHDVSQRVLEQREKIQAAREQASRDPLTDLYNHSTVEARIGELLGQEGRVGAMLIIDVDDFKRVNDTLGHIYGDSILSDIACHLKEICGPEDVAGRVGGDEFVVFLSGFRREEEIAPRLEAVLDIFRRASANRKVHHETSGSIGVAFFPADAQNYTALFEKADAAMYAAKRDGKNRYAIYTSEMDAGLIGGPLPDRGFDLREVSQNNFRNNMVEYLFRVFAEHPDVNQGVPVMLDLLGSLFLFSRAYIYERTGDGAQMRSTFEWCGPGVPSIGKKDPLPQGILPEEEVEFDGESILQYPEAAPLENERYISWLRSRGTKACFQCPIRDGLKVVAVVGFEVCDQVRHPTVDERYALSLASEVLSLVLTRARKQELSLRQKSFSEQLLQLVQAGIYGVDRNSHEIVFFNDHMRPDGLAVGQLCHQAIRGLDAPCPDCPLLELEQGGERVVREQYHLRDRTWTATSAAMIRWEDGRDIALLCSQDITAYRADAARIEFLDENLPGGMMGGYLEPGYPLYFINSRMLQYLGYDSEAEFAGDNQGLILNAIHPEDRSIANEQVSAQVAKGGEHEVVYRIRKKDGTYLWFRDVGMAVEAEDGRRAFISVYIDVTRQVDLEDQLALYRNASQGGAFVCQVDEGLTLLYANDIYYQVYECTAEQMARQMDNRCIGYIHPDDRLRVLSLLRAALDVGESRVTWEMRVITGRGNSRWILTCGAFEYQNGQAVLNGFVTDITETNQLREQILRNEERYRIALGQTNITVWELDMQTRRVLAPEGDGERGWAPEVFENIPESLISLGLIHPDSVRDARTLYEKLYAGAATVQGDILVRDAPKEDWKWQRITYTTIFSAQGEPLRAVAVGEDVTRQKEAEIRYQQELDLRNSLSEGVLASSRTNLTKNRVEAMRRTDRPGEGIPPDMTYEQLLQVGLETMDNPNDRERYTALLNREALFEAFRKGEETLSVEYRRKDRQGRLIWVGATTRLVRSATSGDLYAYGTIRNIDRQKTIELALLQRADKDPATGAYNQETAIRMMEEAMTMARREKMGYAMLIFDVDHFSLIIRQSGYVIAEKVLKETTELMRARFGAHHIIGRFYGDELAIFLGDDPDLEQAKTLAEEVRQAISMPYMFPGSKTPVTLSVGVARGGGEVASFDALHHQARVALETAKLSGRNRCAVYHPQQIEALAAAEEEGGEIWPEMGRFSREAEGLLLRCAFALTSGMDTTQTMQTVLREVARYYGAWSCHLACREEGESWHTYLWKGKDLPDQPSAGDTLLFSELFGQWKELVGDRVILLEDMEELGDKWPGLYHRMKEAGLRSMYIAALDLGERQVGYLSLNAPTRNLGQAAPLEAVRHFLANELIRRRMGERHEFLSYHDSLTGLLSRNSFQEYERTLREEGLISIGLVSADINGLKRVNTDYGAGTGDNLIREAAAAMRGCFPTGKIYRFAGDEFLAVCENLTREAFQAQVAELRRRGADLRPYGLSVGHIWADNDIHLADLLIYASQRMMAAKQEYYRSLDTRTKNYDPEILKGLRADLESGRFSMYLQPKADIRTGKVVGAEALVRYRNADGRVVGPSHFIPMLEREGFIRYVDLFGLEEVCKMLFAWRQEGLAPMVVALNFSRVTLLEEGLVDTVDAVVGRYGLDRGLLEVEITESMGEVERESVARVAGALKERGYRIAMDDFGTKYSNISALTVIELDALKLDKSLVNDLPSNESTRIIVRNVLSTCRELGIQSVAEGVESVEQLNILRDMGCDQAQGYFFNKPIPQEDFQNQYLR